MTIPDKVRICGVDYIVTEIEHVIEDDELCYGTLDPTFGEIQLSMRMSRELQGMTLLHEILHAIEFQYGILALRDDEETVDRLSKALYQVIMDNPKVFNNET